MNRIDFIRAILSILVILPFFSALLIGVLKDRGERLSSLLATSGVSVLSLVYILVLGFWFSQINSVIIINLAEVIHIGTYTLNLVMMIDAPALTYIGLNVFCSAIIIYFSKVYLHREKGYARFFFFIFLLMGGINLISLANNLEVFFIGWETIGLASFFLIGFYYYQNRSAFNAITVFTIYRIGDLGLLLSIWLSHLAESDGLHVGFDSLGGLAHIHTTTTLPEIVFIWSICLLVAAAAKSAQWPFSFWLPKAMEGPTPSSAIFYGALSVHAGVLLLLRTSELWFPSEGLRIVVGTIGLLSAISATICGRTQSSIKGQLAYASVAQTGLMFIELSLGLNSFVLYHIVAHSMLRSFQLLVSPSIIANIMQEQNDQREKVSLLNWSIEDFLPKKLKNTLYVFAIQDSYLERILLWVFVRPLHHAWAPFGFAGVLLVSLMQILGSIDLQQRIVISVGLAAQCFFALRALVEKRSLGRLWGQVALSNACLCLMAILIGNSSRASGLLFFGCMLPVWLFTQIRINRMERRGNFSLVQFHGRLRKNPRTMWLLLICTVYLIAIPPSPLFFAEDFLLHSLSEISVYAGLPLAFALALNGISLIHAMTRVAMGNFSGRSLQGLPSS